MELLRETIESRSYLARIMPAKSKKSKGFCRQDREALDLIANYFDSNQKIRTAIAIYVSLTYHSYTKDRIFYASIRKIAERSGSSPATVKRYLKEFLRIELITKNGLVKTGGSMTNAWRLSARSELLASQILSLQNRIAARNKDPTAGS